VEHAVRPLAICQCALLRLESARQQRMKSKPLPWLLTPDLGGAGPSSASPCVDTGLEAPQMPPNHLGCVGRGDVAPTGLSLLPE